MKTVKNVIYIVPLLLVLFIIGCPPFPVTIITPSDGDHFEIGEVINFTGTARDLIEGELSGDALVWTSSIDGEIGTGSHASRNDLSEGKHEIILTAINSSGEKGLATITITIGETVPITTTTTISTTTLRFMLDNRPDNGYDAPQVYGWLEEIIDIFKEVSDVHVELIEGSEGNTYEDRLLAALESEEPPDLVWVPYSMAYTLAERGYVVPLDEWIDPDSDLTRETPDWVMEQFSYEGRLYGIAAEDEGEGSLNAYMMTVPGRERAGASIIEFISLLKSEVIFNPLPNLVILDLNLILGDEELHEGEELLITTVVENRGRVAADGIDVTVMLDDEHALLEEMIDFLEPNTTAEFEFTFTLPEEGDHSIEAMVDFQNQITERDEDDNWSKESFKVISDSGPGPSTPPPVVKATSTPFTIDGAAYRFNVMGMGPKVIFDGTNYFVAWAKQNPLYHHTYSHQLYGMRISPSGTILDSGGFVIASKKSKYNTFNIAFDGTNYLVVWEEDVYFGNPSVNYNVTAPYIIEGARVSTSGTVLDTTPISIDTAPTQAGSNYLGHEMPDVCFSGSNFIVTYHDTNYMGGKSENIIVAKQVSSSGTVLSGKTTLVNHPNITCFGQQRVVWNQSEGLLGMLGHNSTTNHYGIHSTALYFSGGALTAGTVQTVASKALGTCKYGYIHWFARPVVASSASGNYLVAYEDERNKTANKHGCYWPDLSASLVQSPAGNPGGLVTDKGKIVSGKVEEFPAVDFDGKNYCVVYSHSNGCHSYVGAVRVTPDGVKGTTTYFKTAYDLVSQVDVAFGTTNGLVVFEDFNPPLIYNGPNQSDGIFGQFIEKTP